MRQKCKNVISSGFTTHLELTVGTVKVLTQQPKNSIKRKLQQE